MYYNYEEEKEKYLRKIKKEIAFNIKEHILPAYLKSLSKDINYVCGSRGSGKTSFAVACVIYKALTGKSVLVLRKAQKQHKNSTFSELVEFIDKNLPGIEYKAITSPVCQIQLGKSAILFGEAENTEKIKSMRPLRSNPVGLIWWEESTEILDKLSYKEALERINQVKLTFGRSVEDEKIKMIFTYNPDKPGHWLQEKEEQLGFENNESFTRTTFKENKFLNKDFINEMEKYRDSYPEYYKQVALGQWINLGESVYRIRDFNKLVEADASYDFISIGVDLGSSDATTFVATGFAQNYNKINIVENYHHDNKKERVQKDRSDSAYDLIDFCKMLISKYNCNFIKINCEYASGGNYFIETVEKMLYNEGLPIIINKAKKVLITNRIVMVNMLLTSQRLKIKEHLPVFNEMKQIKYINNKREDKNDHSLNAFEYSIQSETELLSVGQIL